MIRYDRPSSTDWVEIEGTQTVPYRVLVSIQTEHATYVKEAAFLIKNWSITDRDGQPVPLHDIEGLNIPQYAWVRDCISDAVRDEKIDPEV